MRQPRVLALVSLDFWFSPPNSFDALQVAGKVLADRSKGVEAAANLCCEVVDKRAQQPLQLALTLKDSVGSFAGDVF